MFDAEKLLIPTGVQCELIISDDVRAFLRIGEVIENGGADPSRYLPASTGGLAATWVMHCFAVKLRTMFGWARAARGHRPAVALPKVETMIDMSVDILAGSSTLCVGQVPFQ